MITQEYELSVTAFESEEAYKQYQDASKALDAFCSSVNFLDTVITNKAFDLVVDFCGETGDVQNSVKIFSPVLQEGQSEREIFIEVGGKVVETITQSAFEAGGARAGQIIGTAVFATGSISTSGLASAPAFIMGATTGGAVYLAGKYIGIPIGEAVGEYSKEYWGEVYDRYIKEKGTLSNNKIDVINTQTNEIITYGIDENSNIVPEYQTDLTTNTVVLLQPNQTISHVAQNTPYSSDELLEYNNLSQEEAKRLPVGYVVQIPKGVNNIEGGYGIIKEYESYDGSKIYYVPNQYGSKDVVTIDKEGNLIRNDVETNYDLMLLMRADEQSQEYVNKIDISKLEKYASRGYIMSDASFYEPNSQTISYEREDGSICQITYDTNNDLLIYGDPSNPQKITFTDDKGDYQVWERDKNGEFVRINSIDYSVVTNTAINQIGSLIISNNPDFSNIEKIAVSTSVATIADFATYKGTDEFNSSQEGVDNLKGAVVSFAVSSYFAKNDNISDLLGMDGTFLGDLADFTVSFTTSYSIGVLANNGFSFDALSNAFSSTTNSATGAITPSSYSTALTCRLINIF